MGRAVTRAARGRELTVRSYGRAELDVTRSEAVRDRLLGDRPDWVIHCAAYTDVDGAEREPERARRLNVDGTRAVADAASEVGAGVVYLSTDYVFDGTARRPYRPEDPISPLSVYGRTKADGEAVVRDLDRHLVVRTSWVFGRGGRGFASFVLRRADGSDPLRVVEGEISRPTLDDALAEAVLDLVEGGRLGTFHVACGGWASRVELARAIVEAAGGRAEVVPVTAEEFGAEAPRPPYSVLDLDATEEVLGRPPLDWREAVRRWVATHDESGSEEAR